MQKTFDISQKLLKNDDILMPGMLSCQGCGASLAMKFALKGLGEKTMVVIPACCWSIIVGVYPYTSLDLPVIHVPIETAGAAASGIRAALNARGKKGITVMAWAGDGGTFDIGLQSLSGAAERNEDILYVCYDNEAYMNTGIQRSSATPTGAWTTTTPAEHLKEGPKKDIEKIMAAHGIPYIATVSIAYPDDFIKKFKKAKKIKGTRFIHILSPCPPGWQTDSNESVKLARMATQSKVFPVYEIENGKYRINIYPEKEISIEDYIKSQGRFNYISKPVINSVRKQVNKKWQYLIKRSEES